MDGIQATVPKQGQKGRYVNEAILIYLDRFGLCKWSDAVCDELVLIAHDDLHKILNRATVGYAGQRIFGFLNQQRTAI